MSNKYQFMSDHELEDLIIDNKTLMLSNFPSFDKRREYELAAKQYDAELKRRHQMMQDYKQKNTRTVNAFQNDMSFMGPCKGNIVIKTKKRSQRSSKPKPSRSRTTPNMKNSVLNNGRKVNSPATTTSRDFFSKRRPHTPPKEPLAKSRTRHESPYNVVDEDDDKVEEHMFWKPRVEKLSGSMEAVIVYPSRDDKDSVEVNCKDMKCLEPGNWLSSTIISSAAADIFFGNMIRNCHFFNTFFYPQLQKKYKGKSFSRFRKWWKTVDLFRKAYLFIPVNLSSHWSLAIICIPNEEDKTGPVILHMDSLRAHPSRLIFDNIRSFLEEEWSYLQMKSGKITDEICKNLDDQIIEKKINVPQQKNGDDCGLFVLLYIEHFLKEAPERLREKDLSMFSEKWFSVEEAFNLRRKIKNLLVGEFKLAKDKETAALAPEN